eukprot:78206_1
MSSTLLTETKEDSSSTTPNINSTNDIQSTAEAKEAPTQPTPGAKQPTKKKKKKKNAILYQQTAVKYYNGFMKNKRYKKGIKLSTGCAIFKTAWELPESNGLILPSRVMRHFKQVLPKKPPPKTKKTKKKANADTIEDINPVQVIVDESSTSSQLPEDEPFVTRSRTIQNMHNPSTISPQLITAANNTTHQHEYNRTMLTLASTGKINTNTNTLSLINAQNLFCDQIEAMIDEQKFDEDTVKTKNKKHIISRSVDITQQMFEDDEHEIDPKPIEQDRNSSSIEEIPPHVYDDHAHIVQDDLKPDVEEQPTIQMRAQTIGVREIRAHVEMEEDEEPKKDINAATKPTNVYDDHAHIIEDDLKPDVEELPMMEVRAQTLNLRDHIHEDDHEEEEHKEAKKKKKKKSKADRKLDSTIMINFVSSAVCSLHTTFCALTFPLKGFFAWWPILDYAVSSICLFLMLGANRRFVIHCICCCAKCADCCLVQDTFLTKREISTRFEQSMQENNSTIPPTKQNSVMKLNLRAPPIGTDIKMPSKSRVSGTGGSFHRKADISCSDLSTPAISEHRHKRSTDEFYEISFCRDLCIGRDDEYRYSMHEWMGYLDGNGCYYKSKLLWTWLYFSFCCCHCYAISLYICPHTPKAKRRQKIMNVLFESSEKVMTQKFYIGMDLEVSALPTPNETQLTTLTTMQSSDDMALKIKRVRSGSSHIKVASGTVDGERMVTPPPPGDGGSPVPPTSQMGSPPTPIQMDVVSSFDLPPLDLQQSLEEEEEVHRNYE